MSRKIYTDEELLDELRRFYKENGRVPTSADMKNSNGYISIKQYITRFGTFNNALKKTGLKLNKRDKYTKEEVILKVHNFYNKYNIVPTSLDYIKYPEIPSPGVCIRLFGSWNKMLIACGFNINKTQMILTGDETCDICGTNETNHWNNVDELRICDKCNRNKRDFIHGILNPNSTTGVGYISEYIIHNCIINSVWLNNNIDTFNSDYDMYHENYGYISIKSSSLHIENDINYSSWQFCISNANKIPNTYIFIAFSENKSKIDHVWIISANENIINKQTLRITNSEKGLKRVNKYEVDSTSYNNILQNLNIYELFPFRNLDTLEEVSV